MWVYDFIPFPGETQYIEFILTNCLALFPKLVDQNQFSAGRERYISWLNSFDAISAVQVYFPADVFFF